MSTILELKLKRWLPMILLFKKQNNVYLSVSYFFLDTLIIIFLCPFHKFYTSYLLMPLVCSLGFFPVSTLVDWYYVNSSIPWELFLLLKNILSHHKQVWSTAAFILLTCALPFNLYLLLSFRPNTPLFFVSPLGSPQPPTSQSHPTLSAVV